MNEAENQSEIVNRGIVQVPEGRHLFSLMSIKDNLLASKRGQIYFFKVFQ